VLPLLSHSVYAHFSCRPPEFTERSQIYHRLRPLPRSPVRCCSPVGRSSGVFDLSNPDMDSGRIRRNRPPFSARIRIRESSFDAADPLAKPEVLGGRMTSRRPASTTQTNNDDVTLDHVHESRQFDLPLNHRVQTSPSPIHYETESGLGRIEYGPSTIRRGVESVLPLFSHSVYAYSWPSRANMTSSKNRM